jgi:hypothetical protein
MAAAPSTIDIAIDWLATNWEGAILGAPLTAQLRERYGIGFADAVVIAEAKRRRADK